MRLDEIVYKIFEDNIDELTISAVFDLADDIIETAATMLAKSPEEHKQICEAVGNKIKLDIKKNMEAKRNANKHRNG